MLPSSFNYLAILVGAIAAFMIAGVWYGVIAKKAWIAAVGMTDDNKPSGVPPMVATFVGYLLMGLGTSYVHAWLGVTGLGPAIGISILLWLCFSLPSYMPHIMFAGASRHLLWLDGVHLFLAFLVIGAILALWPAG